MRSCSTASSRCRTTRTADGSSAAWCASSPTGCAARCWWAWRLSYRPIPIELTPAGGGAPVQGLYLPGLDTNGKLDSIVVRASEFTSTSGYAIRTGGSDYRIRLNRIIKKGADWIKARFEIEAKQA